MSPVIIDVEWKDKITYSEEQKKADEMEKESTQPTPWKHQSTPVTKFISPVIVAMQWKEKFTCIDEQKDVQAMSEYGKKVLKVGESVSEAESTRIWR